jgi:CDP-glucose 4,6-dehydratase
MDSYLKAYRGRRVLVTGHTGFKGAWLCEWLLALGAEVRGYSLAPPTTPSLFDQLSLAKRLPQPLGDIRERSAVAAAVGEFQPDYVFHLAAQSLVRQSHDEPVETYATNVLGTVHVLEALRELRSPCAAVFVTSDKCYASQISSAGYREEDALGGRDPYSSSKAAAELAVAAWRASFFPPDRIVHGKTAPVGIASARAGNVIGGGDWAADRIVPDCIRSLQRGAPIVVRNPASTRPWQHVLESLSGYLVLAARLHGVLTASPAPLEAELRQLAAAFNFGPEDETERSVQSLVEEVLGRWPGQWEPKSENEAPFEEHRLRLDSTRARAILGWRSRWNFQQTVARTVDWYRAVTRDQAVAEEVTRQQISEYMRTAAH